MTQEQSNDRVWDKISRLETETAAIKSDIRGLYGGVDEIRDVLKNMQMSNRPNINALFIASIAVCSFFVTIGGLTVSPIWREMNELNGRIQVLNENDSIIEERLSDRMYRDEELLLEIIKQQAYQDGMLDVVRGK